mgnify:CR=1 FL=1
MLQVWNSIEFGYLIRFRNLYLTNSMSEIQAFYRPVHHLPINQSVLVNCPTYRYALHRVFLELPAGKIDANEHPLDTARRELREETGYQAKVWHHLGVMHPCIGYSDEKIEIFWAEGLVYVGHERDQGEFLEVIEMSIADALLAVHDGEITDAKTITALLWAEKIIGGIWSAPE